MKKSRVDGLKVAMAQMPVVAGNPRENTRWIIEEIIQAEKRKTDIIIFPEQCVAGYIIGDKFEDDAFVKDIWKHNERIVAATAGKDIIVIFGTTVTDNPEATGEDGRMRKINGGFVVQNGEVVKNRAGLAFFAKTNLPVYRMFDEDRHMTTLQDLATERNVPIEDLLQPFDIVVAGRKIAIGVIDCEDGWPKDHFINPPLLLARAGIDLLVNVSASPWGWQKNQARHRAFRAYLAEIGVPMLYVNASRPQNNGKGMYVFDGVSTLYNSKGEVVLALPPFYSGVEDVTLFNDMQACKVQEKTDIEQLWEGVVQGVRGLLDTLPQRLRPAVVGLSGGLDSAVVASVMTYVLGSENVVGCNMPYGDYNSPETKGSAAFTAEALGIKFDVVPIDEPVNWHARTNNISPGTNEFKTVMAVERMSTLSGRARSLGGFFTCNGNKTEIAFGFYTNDGDGRGAFALIGDLLKGEVAQLGYYLNTVVYGKEVVPWELITGELPPMDELGPRTTQVRKDPFDFGYVMRDGTFVRGYHDQMVHAFLGFRKDPEWFLEHYLAGDLEELLLLPAGKLNTLFKTQAEFVSDLERCWELFHNNIWKRIQSATTVPVSKRPFSFDYRESILPAYYTDRYYDLRVELLTEYPLPNYWPKERRDRFISQPGEMRVVKHGPPPTDEELAKLRERFAAAERR